MPLPQPRNEETRGEFMARCMSNDIMNEEFPDSDQRYAVCLTQYDESRKEESLEKSGSFFVKKGERLMERKQFAFELKADVDNLTFEGYGNVFDIRDLGGDIVKKGAFKKTIKERMPKKAIKLLWGHIHPFGMPSKLEEDSKGLYVFGKATDTAENKDRMKYIKEKVVDGMSIGYAPVKFYYEHEKDNETGITESSRILTEIKLYEITVTPFPMNEQSRIKDMEEMTEFKETLKEIVAFMKEIKNPQKGEIKDVNEFLNSLKEADEDTIRKTIKALEEMLKPEGDNSTLDNDSKSQTIEIDSEFQSILDNFVNLKV